MTTAACRAYADPTTIASPGRATLNGPRSMYRGETATVRLVVVDGDDQSRADDAARIPGQRTEARAAAYYAPMMEALLTGEGFAIETSPSGRSAVIESGSTGEAVWEWRVTALRGPRHYLQARGWVMRPDAAGRWVRGMPMQRGQTLEIAVPVRWVPEWLHDAMTDSIDWFALGNSWVKALTVLVGAVAALWVALLAFRRRA